MIWVIGDIHGMFDPLKRLVSRLHAIHANADENGDRKIDKLIFLGDYIDYGPSTKEVIDFIMDLPFETVCMMGNHDDLMLQFIEKSDLFEKFGNVWFRGNGGQRTVSSFFPHLHFSEHEEHISRDEFALEEKYLNFFRNLKISHVETIGDMKLAFIHGILNSDFPLDEQLALKTYEDFHTWRKENKIWIEETPLWNRKEPKQRFGDYILVHGHIPTTKLDQIWKDLHGYDPNLELPFLKFSKKPDESEEISFYQDYASIRYTATADQLVSINADTGAVYGHRLTAIGFSEQLLSDSQIITHQVCVSTGYRFAEDLHTYEINFFGF